MTDFHYFLDLCQSADREADDRLVITRGVKPNQFFQIILGLISKPNQFFQKISDLILVTTGRGSDESHYSGTVPIHLGSGQSL
nr:hypothetical protein [uncultured Desulfobulbus sp.]